MSKLNKRITIRISEHLYNEIIRIAKKNKVGINTLTRVVLEESILNNKHNG